MRSPRSFAVAAAAFITILLLVSPAPIKAEQRREWRQGDSSVVNLEIPRSGTRTAIDASSSNTGLTEAASQIAGGGGGSVTNGPDAFGTTWKPLKIGAGGFLTGMSTAQDNTIVLRTDTYGAYLWTGSQWQQLVTSTRMPASFVRAAQLYNSGVYEIQVA